MLVEGVCACVRARVCAGAWAYVKWSRVSRRDLQKYAADECASVCLCVCVCVCACVRLRLCAW